jgi:hypothetical protein
LQSKEYQWECQGAKQKKKKGKAAGGTKETRKREKKKGCMEINVHIGNKWWKKTTIYSKEMETTINCVEDTEETVCSSEGSSTGKRGARNWEEERVMGKENTKTRWKMQKEGRRRGTLIGYRILLFTELFVTLCEQFCSWVNKAIIIINSKRRSMGRSRRI